MTYDVTDIYNDVTETYIDNIPGNVCGILMW